MRSKVAVLRTTPDTVFEDYARLMRLVNYTDHLPRGHDTLLKVNISWHRWFPACSSAPWQVEGVVRTLLEDGYPREQIIPVHNRTVVVNDLIGIRENKFDVVDRRYGLRRVHNYSPEVEWVEYTPKSGKYRVLGDVYRRTGFKIPKFFFGKNIIHLPTVKTHVFTTITGAMKNAFGGLLNEKRHWTHAVIHETLVDLLRIQKEIHSGLFAVMDGTIMGDGPGPRCMTPHDGHLILASADQVAIDAVSAKIQGFDPMSLKFIRCAHEDGLGVGDPREIEIVGMDRAEFEQINFHHRGTANTFASRGQKMIYHGPLKPLEGLLLRSPIVGWSYIASRVYHDLYWWKRNGESWSTKFKRESPWGQLFDHYEERTESLRAVA